MTTYFNNEGEQAYYYYNDAGLVTHAIDALGRETKTQWHNNQKISETNALGQTTSYLIIMMAILHKLPFLMSDPLSINIILKVS
ncbi:hypothetical protein [Proteus vulgaris]|uniref:hypothetical protein n=1 Tax=Proteus vulgaris TaxID=585 RepID=UPI003F6906CE